MLRVCMSCYAFLNPIKLKSISQLSRVTSLETSSMILAALLSLRVASSAYFSQFSMREPNHDPCYEPTGRPIRCVPEFINAAFGKPVIASSTCGMNGPSRFCTVNEGADGVMRENCDVCDASQPSQSHPASLITDFNAPGNMTCWVSEPSLESYNVSLTLSLGKKFEPTYPCTSFTLASIPMACTKSTDHGKTTWIPFQYYSSDCRSVFGRAPDVVITKHNEQEALCTNSHNLAPRANRIAFPFLENRPSAVFFESSPVLQDWVTATDIRIQIIHVGSPQTDSFGVSNDVNDLSNNTAGENNSDGIFFAIGELAVGGRCNLPVIANIIRFGSECETCKPFHFDRPWRRATSQAGMLAVACNCNMHAKRCRFDQELYRLSENSRLGTNGFESSKLHVTMREMVVAGVTNDDGDESIGEHLVLRPC
ncbi:laminin [Cooperia oncophora]